MKSLTPHQAYVKVTTLAEQAKQSLRAYCFARHVNHSTVCKWRGKRKGTVFLSILEKLYGPPLRKSKAAA